MPCICGICQGVEVCPYMYAFVRVRVCACLCICGCMTILNVEDNTRFFTRKVCKKMRFKWLKSLRKS